MITFALDTNIVSYILRGNETVLRRLEATIKAGNQIIIPPIVYYEIRRGLLAKNAATQIAQFDELLAEIEVAGIDISTLDIAASTYAALKNAGKPISDADLLIGAYCIKNNFTLVTNNIKHFEIIDGLDLVNWSDA
ncbi:MAG: type II toxin-antitoxin system VapC family toxin [Clostridiales Family XIII bacterium]|jgi:predicted nucleic acid-binding protein|nr:type II toxin-antitoxin system VapC family toxin [Clostridiales Family XIII bacterium]